ncbi:ETX/MTX2 family pore-forming toxin [Streptomyces pacificus]|uniref:ETX/MTX2 family pore-forming toxin n=1 Tax=Streptomyces pacificus TaxID=2705029 RepID=UPI001565E933|nr:ETX/MTX2 family pore-forming toxin [Streptomyces pacificus]
MALVAATPASAATAIPDLDAALLAQYRHVDRSVVGVIPALSASGTQVTGVGTPDVSDVSLLFVGTASMDNRTSLQQKLTSQPLSKAKTTATTVTVTNGFSSANKVSATFKLSDAVSVGSETVNTVSYSTATAQTASETDTYTLPSQNVDVPPMTRACVYGDLVGKVATGKLSLTTKLSGKVIAMRIGAMHMVFSDMYPTLVKAQSKSGAPALPSGFSLNSSTRSLDFKGAATYSTTYGTHFNAVLAYTSLDKPCPATPPTGGPADASADSVTVVKRFTVPLAGNVG